MHWYKLMSSTSSLCHIYHNCSIVTSVPGVCACACVRVCIVCSVSAHTYCSVHSIIVFHGVVYNTMYVSTYAHLYICTYCVSHVYLNSPTPTTTTLVNRLSSQGMHYTSSLQDTCRGSDCLSAPQLDKLASLRRHKMSSTLLCMLLHGLQRIL